MRYYVYILANGFNNIVYVGVTNNIVRRIQEHKNHIDPNSFTARYNVHKLVYCENYPSPREAILREKQLKGWNRRRKNELITNFNPTWRDLYEDIL